ncbi:MAG: hypothetical protein ILO53_00190 [Clostridia bacterium]|nr:hypothetical protein [Clostridia bacterium]
MKKIILILAAAVLAVAGLVAALSGCAVRGGDSANIAATADNSGKEDPSDTATPSGGADPSGAEDPSGAADPSGAENPKGGYSFVELNMDWPVYATTKELADASDFVFSGRLLDISFEVLELSANDRTLYTVYTVEVDKTYKGSDASIRRIVKIGGLDGYNVEAQAKAMRDAGIAANAIPYVKNVGKLNVGTDYLFCTCARTDEYDNIVTAGQFVFDLSSENAISLTEFFK